MLIVAPTDTVARVGQQCDRSDLDFEAYPFPPMRTLRRLVYDQSTVPGLATKFEADVLFSSNGFATRSSPCPQALLVRNLMYFEPLFRKMNPVTRAAGVSLRLRRWWSLRSIRWSDLVLVPTKAAGDFVRESAPNVQAIHYGFDHANFFRENPDTPLVRQMRERRRSGERVLLGVSNYARHKNFETLIEALPAVRDRVPVHLFLTIAREHTAEKKAYDHLMNRLAALDLERSVSVVGPVRHEFLSGVYGAADAFVFPSFSESFGHPLVEAMASGLPVVASSTAGNRELVQDAGLFFETFDSVDCSRVLLSLLTDGALREEMSRKCQERSTHFSWERYARELVALFESLMRR